MAHFDGRKFAGLIPVNVATVDTVARAVRRAGAGCANIEAVETVALSDVRAFARLVAANVETFEGVARCNGCAIAGAISANVETVDTVEHGGGCLPGRLAAANVETVDPVAQDASRISS